MKKILIVGAGGQIGSELTRNLRDIYGDTNVVCSDLRPLKGDPYERGPVERIDSTQIMQIAAAVKQYNIDTIYNLAAILSATAELNPMLSAPRRRMSTPRRTPSSAPTPSTASPRSPASC